MSYTKLLFPKVLVFVGAVNVAGCTQDQFFPDASKTSVDGQIFLVRELRPGTFQAFPNEPDGDLLLAVDAKLWDQNLRAIEQVTGCQVLPGSAKHDYSTSIAAVDC